MQDEIKNILRIKKNTTFLTVVLFFKILFYFILFFVM
jgi:hypothetical protein